MENGKIEMTFLRFLNQFSKTETKEIGFKLIGLKCMIFKILL